VETPCTILTVQGVFYNEATNLDTIKLSLLYLLYIKQVIEKENPGMSTFEELGEQKEVHLTQGTVSYRERGSGETLVFIHGLLVNGDLWRKVVPSLAQSYRCITLDLPLGAHSIALNAKADLTPPGIARLIADFLAALDLSSITLVANDTGGAFTQIAITAYPQRVGRLILTNCDAYENFLPPTIRVFQWFAFLPGFIALLGQLGKLAVVQRFILKLVAKHPVENRAVQSYMHPITQNSGIRHDVGKVLRGISSRYTLAAAQKFTNFNQPVLLVWAPEDRIFTLQYAKRLQKAFPHTTLRLVQDSYAFISEDQPAQLIDHIESFLENTQSSTLTNERKGVQ
jgi:pimeloyl-ACP methyl ester carboxylesterase